MKSSITYLDPGELLAHAAWMRALAKTLVLDEHLADDVVQAAWTAALVRPPRRGVPLRAWLATVVRNLALTGRRSAARRADREERGARSERVPSTAELSERAELQRLLVESVQGLPEPYREVVLLRFFEDMQPGDIARHLELPVNTVRTRLARALERLRESLDRSHDGERRSWCLALIPLAALDRTSVGLLSLVKTSTLGVWIMSHPLKAATTVAVVLFGTMMATEALELAFGPGAEHSAGRRLATPAEAAAAFFERPAVHAGDKRADRESVGTDGHVRGRVVDLDGQPVPGAALQARGERFGRSKGRSDADGRFHWAPNEDENLVLASHPDFVALRESAPIVVGTELELRMTPLDRTALEVVVIDDTSQRPVPRFRVECWSLFEGRHGAERRPLSTSSEKVLDGKFAGEVEFAASFPLLVRATVHTGFDSEVQAERVVEPQAGEALALRFELDLDEPEREPGAQIVFGRVLDATTRESVPGAYITLLPYVGIVDGRRHFSSIEREVQSMRDGRFRIAVPHAGPATHVHADHPHYEPGEGGSEGGEEVVIELRKRGALHIQVEDRDGRPVAGAHLLARALGEPPETMDPAEVLYLHARTDAEGRWEVPHLVAGRYGVYVLPGPGLPDEAAIAQRSIRLAACEVRELVLRIDPQGGVSVGGRVIPDFFAPVELVPMFVAYEAEGAAFRAQPFRGGYRVTGVEPGRYLVVLGPAVDDYLDEVPFALLPEVEVSEAFDQVLDFAYPDGTLTGWVSAPEGRDDLTVAAFPVLPPGFAADMFAQARLGELIAAPVDENGCFELRHLPDGRHRIEIRSGTSVLDAREVELTGNTTLERWDLR